MNMSMKSLLITLVLMISIINFSEAQTTTVASCANSLIPCGSYLNSTNPPSSCCDPLKETVATQLKCLCDLFNTPGLLQTFNVNVTQALGLSRLCGIKSDLSSCTAGSAPSPSSSSVPPQQHVEVIVVLAELYSVGSHSYSCFGHLCYLIRKFTNLPFGIFSKVKLSMFISKYY